MLKENLKFKMELPPLFRNNTPLLSPLLEENEKSSPLSSQTLETKVSPPRSPKDTTPIFIDNKVVEDVEEIMKKSPQQEFIDLLPSLGGNNKSPVQTINSPPTSLQGKPIEAEPAHVIHTPKQEVVEKEKITKRPNYLAMTNDEKQFMRNQFTVKFEILRNSNPNLSISNPPDSYTLDQIHDLYEHYVKQIIVSMNTEQYKVYLVLFFLGTEVFVIKVLGLDFSGYTLSRMKCINKYEKLLTELGEQYYLQGGSNWPIEARLLIMILGDAIIFLLIKYLTKYIDMPELSDALQGLINTFMDKAAISQPTLDQNGIPQVPTMDVKQQQQDGGFDLNGLLGGLFKGKDPSEMLAGIGSKLTSALGQKVKPKVDFS